MTDRPPDAEEPRVDDLDDEPLEPRVDPDVEPEPGDEAEVEPPGTDDPDLEASRTRAPTRDPKTLTTEELRPEEEIVEYEPPFEPTRETASGRTTADELTGETLDERVEQEEPDQPA